MEINDRLKQIRLMQHMSQTSFAAEFHLAQTTYGPYELGKRAIPIELMHELASKFGVNLHWLITGQGSMYLEGEGTAGTDTYVTEKGREVEPSPREPSVYVPVLASRVSAGSGEEWLPEDFREGVMIPVLRRFTRSHDVRDIFSAEVKGDSMMGAHLFDGDYVFAVRGLVEGDGIYVISINGSVYVKRIELDLLGEKVRIISENPHYSPMELPVGQVTVLGKVIGWLHHHPY